MTLPNASQRALRQYIESVEKLEAEKKEIADEIKEKFAEARGAGFDVKTMRQIIKLRKLDPDQRSEQEALLHTYMHAMEMFEGTPMGQYISEQEGAPLQ